jgi:RHS repeat-associated protein
VLTHACIRYNVVNLPDTIQFTAGHENYYTYDASGKKLELTNYTLNSPVIVPQGAISPLPGNSSAYTKTVTDYCGNVIYQNGSLKEVLTPEGYWQNSVFYYYLKDHQGNTRAVINPSGTVMECSDYYPDGMRFESSTSNSAALPYRYNGKELEAMNGLNEYDYGARRRETGIPVWTTMDPLAEKYYGVSPYAYVNNNLINKIDPIGLTDYDVQNSTGNISVAPDLQFIIDNIIVKIYYTLPKSNPGESDTFYATNDKGERTGDSYTVKEGVDMKSIKGKNFRGDQITVPNNKEGKGLFEFMADHTNVEWSQFKLESGKNILSTSHKNGTELAAPSVWEQIYATNDNIIEWNHSHPGNYWDQIMLPSGRYYGFNNSHNSGDFGFLGQIHDYMNSNIKANVYVPALGEYFQYDLLGIKQATLKTIKKP